MPNYISRHQELIGFELLFRNQMPEEQLRPIINMLDEIFELGIRRGKELAILESMMGDISTTEEKE